MVSLVWFRRDLRIQDNPALKAAIDLDKPIIFLYILESSSKNKWVAGCGIDSQPYFRIFNPVLQSKKFDPQGDYIRHWIPELSALDDQYIHVPWETPKQKLKDANVELGHTYPNPIVDHSIQRTKALYHYKPLKGELI